MHAVLAESRYPKPSDSSSKIIDISGREDLDILPPSETELKELKIRGLDTAVSMRVAKDTLNKWEELHSEDNINLLYNDKQFTDVLKIYNTRISVFPTNLELHNIAIRSLYSISEYNQCIELCKEILLVYSDYTEAKRFIGRSAKNIGLHDLSCKYFVEIADMDPDDIDSRIMLIRHYYNSENWNDVLKYCKQLIKLNSDSRDGHLFLVRTYQKLGEDKKALIPAKKFHELDRNNLEGIIVYGKILYNLGREKESREYLEKALEISPNEKRARRTLALVYDKCKEFELALELFTKECVEQPDDFSNWEKRINTLYRLNREEEAKNSIPMLLELMGDTMEANLLCNLIADSFSWDEICEQISIKCDENWGRDPNFHLKIIDFNLEKGDLTCALKHIQKCRTLCLSDKSVDNSFNKDVDERESRLRKMLEQSNTTITEVKEHLSRGETLLQIECVLRSIIEKTHDVEIRKPRQGKINVAMITSSLGRGGAERQVVTCLNGLDSHSKISKLDLYCYKIDNTAGRMDTYASEIEELGIPMHQFGSRLDWNKKYSDQIHNLEPWRPFLDQIPQRMRRDIEPLYLSFMKTKPDIVHAWQDQTNITSSIAALMAGVPGIVLFARSQRPDKKTMMHIRNRPYLRKSYDAMLQHQRLLLCLNSSAGSKSYAEWLGRKEKEFPVIHNGVDFKSISDASANADLSKIISKLGITKKAIIVGSVFRFVKEKQPEIWVEALQKVIEKQPNVHAIIVGDGGLKDATQKIINEKGLEKSIHLVGQTREVAAWLERFDLFLLTSMVEGLPNVLIEAQAFGVPVVSTNAGGSADTFIDGKTGKLCESHDPEVIANTVLSCIQDEKWLAIASKASSTHGRKAFGTKPMLKRLMQIYETSLERQINSK